MLVKIFSALLLPPTLFVFPILLGLFLRKKTPRLSLLLGVAGIIALLIFSTIAGSQLIVAPLESRAHVLIPISAMRQQAIVVLGGGRINDAPEYGGVDLPSLHALARLQYAAHLHRKTGLPILSAIA